jgi:hypothetical protein
MRRKKSALEQLFSKAQGAQVMAGSGEGLNPPKKEGEHSGTSLHRPGTSAASASPVVQYGPNEKQTEAHTGNPHAEVNCAVDRVNWLVAHSLLFKSSTDQPRLAAVFVELDDVFVCLARAP